MVRNSNWRDNLTLFSHDIQFNKNFDLENILGVELMRAGKTKEALVHFKQSVDMYPYDNNLSNLGVAYEELGHLNETKEYFLKAIHAKTYNTKGHKHDEATW